MVTYQEYLDAPDKVKFIWEAVVRHRSSDEFKMAETAQRYNRQDNVTIKNSVQTLYNMSGARTVDYTAANNQLASNFFHSLVRERVTYSLGNGIIWANDGQATSERLGDKFDKFISDTAKAALIDGVAFGLWNLNQGHTFRLTEFVPFWDETDGSLRAGARFWSLDWGHKPVTVVFYEEDGYTTYSSRQAGGELEEIEPKRAYMQIIQSAQETGEIIVGEDNYGSLPIVPLCANDAKQSMLAGVRPLIDAYDMIQSGFANDLQECAQIYWLIGNASGMMPDDMMRFRDQLKFLHIAAVDTDNSSVTPYTQDVPYSAREACLAQLRTAIFDSCGIFDVRSLTNGSKTATEINAAYQPMDEEADDFEYNVTSFIQQITNLAGVDDYPTYKRNRISNQPEQTNMILSAAQYLDRRTILSLLPFIDNGQVDDIVQALDMEADSRFVNVRAAQNDPYGAF